VDETLSAAQTVAKNSNPSSRATVTLGQNKLKTERYWPTGDERKVMQELMGSWPEILTFCWYK